MIPENFFDKLESSPEQEIVTEILNKSPVKIERIVSYGQSSPDGFWYEQEEDEWVMVLKGEAELEFEDNSVQKMRAGDFIFLPRLKKHRVKSTAYNVETVWLAIFF